jgi:predicted GH43/DUF377 family glycosyl hydrolase
LIIYHGVDKTVGKKGRTYRIGAVMLNEKFKIVARFPEPIFEPKEKYEITGDVSNVTFVSGYVLFENKKNETFIFIMEEQIRFVALLLQTLIIWLKS